MLSFSFTKQIAFGILMLQSYFSLGQEMKLIDNKLSKVYYSKKKKSKTYFNSKKKCRWRS